MDAQTARTITFINSEFVNELMEKIEFGIRAEAFKGKREFFLDERYFESFNTGKIDKEGNFYTLSVFGVRQAVEEKLTRKGFNTHAVYQMENGEVIRVGIIIKW